MAQLCFWFILGWVHLSCLDYEFGVCVQILWGYTGHFCILLSGINGQASPGTGFLCLEKWRDHQRRMSLEAWAGAHMLRSPLSLALTGLNPNSRGNPNSASLVKRVKTNKQTKPLMLEYRVRQYEEFNHYRNWNLKSRDYLENQVKSVQTL